MAHSTHTLHEKIYTKDMAAFSSVSYNHLFPKTHKRQFCYESLAVASSSQIRADGGASVAASTRFFAYPDVCAGGSAVAVLPLTSYGRRHVPTTAKTYQQPLLKLHSSQVHCVDFAPHDRDRTILASGASDGTLHVFRVPEEGLVEDVTSANADTVTCKTGSSVHEVRFHPTAGSIALLAHPKSADVWDCSTQQRVLETNATDHMQNVYSATWSFDGSRFVTTCKDKIIRLFDPRSGNCEATTMGHGSWRPSIAVWLDRDQTFLTTGHSTDMSREVLVWVSRGRESERARERERTNERVMYEDTVILRLKVRCGLTRHRRPQKFTPLSVMMSTPFFLFLLPDLASPFTYKKEITTAIRVLLTTLKLLANC